MIIGQVNPRLEAVVAVIIQDNTGQTQTFNAVIDTGFSNYLTLPLAVIMALQLTFAESRAFSLGDNKEVNFDLYEAVLLWDGEEREIMVLASEAFPLIGMSLLKGFRLFVDVIDGGEVRIERRT